LLNVYVGKPKICIVNKAKCKPCVFLPTPN
jgi:hypothetical protein